jgi:hypothetical protein
MNFESLKQFLEFKTIENDLKSAAQCWAEISARPGGLPCAVGRKAGWACRVCCTWSPRVGRRGGALAGGLVTTSRRQSLGLEHHGRAADAPGKGSGGCAHRCGGWVGLTMGGGDGDDGDRKCAEEGHGGSVAGVDERWLTWPSAEESEGEKRRGE